MRRDGEPCAGDHPARGLTLIEVLVATLVLSFVTLGAVSLLSLVFNQNKVAQMRSRATYLAAARIDQLTARPFQAAASFQSYGLPGEVAATGPPPTLVADYGSIQGHPEFRRIVTLNYNVPAVGMLQVVTEVIWQDLRQGEKRHKLTTYLAPALEGSL